MFLNAGGRLHPMGHADVGVSVPLQRVTSLRRRAQANAPVASYWLRRVLDDVERRDKINPL